MCYNCGCQIPTDPMGKKTLSQGGPSLVEDDFKVMAEGWGMTVEETKKNVRELLEKTAEPSE